MNIVFSEARHPSAGSLHSRADDPLQPSALVQVHPGPRGVDEPRRGRHRRRLRIMRHLWQGRLAAAHEYREEEQDHEASCSGKGLVQRRRAPSRERDAGVESGPEGRETVGGASNECDYVCRKEGCSGSPLAYEGSVQSVRSDR